MRLAKTVQSDSVWLFFHPGFFRIIVVINGKLQLANAFRFASEMDVAYYVLYVLDQLNVKADAVQTWVTGTILENGSVLNMLREYIGRVVLLKECNLAAPGFDPENKNDALRYFSLIHQVLCVS